MNSSYPIAVTASGERMFKPPPNQMVFGNICVTVNEPCFQLTIVVAHEVAHQWFGNLVTMEWWTHLWLMKVLQHG